MIKYFFFFYPDRYIQDGWMLTLRSLVIEFCKPTCTEETILFYWVTHYTSLHNTWIIHSSAYKLLPCLFCMGNAFIKHETGNLKNKCWVKCFLKDTVCKSIHFKFVKVQLHEIPYLESLWLNSGKSYLLMFKPLVISLWL